MAWPAKRQENQYKTRRGLSGLQPDENAATPQSRCILSESIVRGWRPRDSKKHGRPAGLPVFRPSAVGVFVGLLRRAHGAAAAPLSTRIARGRLSSDSPLRECRSAGRLFELAADSPRSCGLSSTRPKSTAQSVGCEWTFGPPGARSLGIAAARQGTWRRGLGTSRGFLALMGRR